MSDPELDHDDVLCLQAGIWGDSSRLRSASAYVVRKDGWTSRYRERVASPSTISNYALFMGHSLFKSGWSERRQRETRQLVGWSHCHWPIYDQENIVLNNLVSAESSWYDSQVKEKRTAIIRSMICMPISSVTLWAIIDVDVRQFLNSHKVLLGDSRRRPRICCLWRYVSKSWVERIQSSS